jgi:hypothetical protein
MIHSEIANEKEATHTRENNRDQLRYIYGSLLF